MRLSSLLEREGRSVLTLSRLSPESGAGNFTHLETEEEKGKERGKGGNQPGLGAKYEGGDEKREGITRRRLLSDGRATPRR